MNPFIKGVHDSLIRLVVPAHLICVRQARVKCYPMDVNFEHSEIANEIAAASRSGRGSTDGTLVAKIENYIRDELSFMADEAKRKWSELFNFMLRWQGIDQSVFEDALRVSWLFHTIDDLEVKTDQYPVKKSQQGMVASYVKPNENLGLSISADHLLNLEPVGAKFLCLSNLRTGTHIHKSVLPEQRGSQVELSINAGSYSELKILSIFPFGKFCAMIGRLGTDMGLSSYDAYGAGNATYLANSVSGISADAVFDNAGIDAEVGANNFAVEDIAKTIIGIRIAYQGLHGLVYPSSGLFQQADDRGFGIFTYSIISQIPNLSDSRRRVLAAMSWLEGSFDSINTYDHANRLSWGISHWISNLGNNLDGELNHVLAYLYKEYQREFDHAFGQYGFSVWYDPSHIDAYGQGRNGYLPFRSPRILFPECHGEHFRNSLRSRQSAIWRNRRSIYSAWVFRNAGTNAIIQRGQVEMLNFRMSVACPPGQPSERDVAVATSTSINPRDPLDRVSRIDECCRQRNITLSDQPGSFQR